jgi:hypothetical protein
MRFIRLLLAVLAGGLAAVVVLPLCLIGLAIWTVSALTRLVARGLEPRHVSWREILSPDPLIGWRPRGNVDAYCLTDSEPDVFHVRTDAEGWPGTRSVAESDVVVFGDSFAFGYGIDSHQTFWNPGPARVKGVGATAYNMVQELLLMQELAPRLSGKHVVWFVCLGNDLIQNLIPSYLHYPTPFVRHTDGGASWEIVTRHAGRRWAFTLAPFRDPDLWLRIAADLHAPTPLARRAYSACEFLIREARDVCAEAGATLTVLTIPDPWHLRSDDWARLLARSANPASCDAHFPDKELGEMCSRLGVAFIAGREFLGHEHYKAVDPHWNAHGHRRVADLLQRVARRPVSAPHATSPGHLP